MQLWSLCGKLAIPDWFQKPFQWWSKTSADRRNTCRQSCGIGGGEVCWLSEARASRCAVRPVHSERVAVGVRSETFHQTASLCRQMHAICRGIRQGEFVYKITSCFHASLSPSNLLSLFWTLSISSFCLSERAYKSSLTLHISSVTWRTNALNASLLSKVLCLNNSSSFFEFNCF